MKDYKEAIESIMKDTTSKVMDHAIKAYRQGYEDGQKEKPQAIYEMKVEEYNKGLNEAWECARKINNLPKAEDLCELFKGKSCYEYSASEAIAKIKEYEEKQTKKSCGNCRYEKSCPKTARDLVDRNGWNRCQSWILKQTEDEIKVGYEVYNLDPENKRIVTAIDGDKAIQLCSNGKYTVDNIDTLHWTGREDWRIKKVLEKITNEV